MPDPIIFLVKVDGYRGRVVLNPLAAKADHQLVIETHSLDAAGGDCWTPLEYRFSKRYVTATLLYAVAFGAQPGQVIEIGSVERSEYKLVPPGGLVNQLSMGLKGDS